MSKNKNDVKLGNWFPGTDSGPAVILAPMSGVTDQPFRSAVARYGATMVVGEMLASAANLLRSRRSAERRHHIREGGPKVIQLAGCIAEDMAEAARFCRDEGADVIDINMGCPAKKVVSGYAGAALMRDEIKAAEIIAATVGAVDIPVTLKMRTGWDQDSRNAPRLARIAEDLGIQAITVHGRTRSQFYDGTADWDFIGEVKQAVLVPVIANGDVRNIGDARHILERSGADGVMIGRAARGRPWLLQQVLAYLHHDRRLPDPGFREQCETLQRHYEELLLQYGRERGMRIARKHIDWYLEPLGVDRQRRRELMQMPDPEEVHLALRDTYERLSERRAA